jgi:hypothetical protein
MDDNYQKLSHAINKMANASLVRPCQRPDRQNETKTTTQCLWRARMLKLRRAGMVSTKRLLAVTSIRSPDHFCSFPHLLAFCRVKG